MSDFPAHDVTRLRHMLDAANKIQQFLDGHERADLETDEMLALAVVRDDIPHLTAHIRAALTSLDSPSPSP